METLTEARPRTHSRRLRRAHPPVDVEDSAPTADLAPVPPDQPQTRYRLLLHCRGIGAPCRASAEKQDSQNSKPTTPNTE